MTSRLTRIVLLVAVALCLAVPLALAQPRPPTPPPPAPPKLAVPVAPAAPASPAPVAAPAAVPTPSSVTAMPVVPGEPLPPQTPPSPPGEKQVVKPAVPPLPPRPPEAPTSPASRESRYSGNWNPGTTTNVRFEATITDQMGSSPPVRKTIAVTVADGGRASVRSGVTVPVASTNFQPAEGKPPITSFNYRDMGLSFDVGNVFVDGNYVRATLSVEYNPVDEKTADAAGAASTGGNLPSFASFKQSLAVAFENGKPIQVTQSSDPVPARDRKMTLDVKATILK